MTFRLLNKNNVSCFDFELADSVFIREKRLLFYLVGEKFNEQS